MLGVPHFLIVVCITHHLLHLYHRVIIPLRLRRWQQVWIMRIVVPRFLFRPADSKMHHCWGMDSNNNRNHMVQRQWFEESKTWVAYELNQTTTLTDKHIFYVHINKPKQVLHFPTSFALLNFLSILPRRPRLPHHSRNSGAKHLSNGHFQVICHYLNRNVQFRISFLSSLQP